MFMKTIIYYRKSTDRDDKQANSLEHQLDNCRRITKSNSFDVVKEIGESRSAKTEWTRPWFNELISICKKGKIDYIIIDEPKRLSRNNIDTSRIIDLLDKNLIKWIIGTSRQYMADNSRDKFLLQLDLSLSKMDNEDRSKDVKEKMHSCIKNTGRFLGKAPFWYRNVTIKKWHKEIHLDEFEAKIVKEMFHLRLENKAFSTIGDIIRSKYGNTLRIKLDANSIHRIVWKTFYYWVFMWKWEQMQGSHKTIITKKQYDKANGIVKWVYQYPRTKEIQGLSEYYLKWFVRDTDGIMLTAYKKKGQTYYLNQYRSTQKVSINENIIFDKFGEMLKEYDEIHPNLKEIDADIIISLLRQSESESNTDIEHIDSKIIQLKEKQNRLLDMSLEWKIGDDVYMTKYNEISNDIEDLEEQKEEYKSDDFEEKTRALIELAGSFYQSYSSANKCKKSEIIKKLLIELSVTTKKELCIEESPIFKSSKMLNFVFGTPTENWTPVSALRRPCPNH